MIEVKTFLNLLAGVGLYSVLVEAQPLEPRQAVGAYPAPNNNNFACRSKVHSNPVVFLHGLGTAYYEDLNVLQTNLSLQGYCTYARTYGAYPAFPFVGGLKSIKDSSKEIASFINEIHTKTGASKIDIVGHSEGGLQSLYVPKFEPGIAALVDRIVAIAPPTHGTTILDPASYALFPGTNLTRAVFDVVFGVTGCQACNEISPQGEATKRLNDGKPIKQPGNTITVIISRDDHIVTPPDTSRVNESGVRNLYVQDYCPNDHVGHNGLVYDTFVWSLVVNGLEPKIPISKQCVQGLPV